MQHNTQSRFNAQVYSQASEWFVELRTGEPDEPRRRAFHAWLKESPAHIGAYLEVTAIWNEGPALDRQNKWTKESLIADARAADSVVALDIPASAPAPASAQSGARAGHARHRHFAIAASLLLACAIAIVAGYQFYRVPAYATAIGEQRSIVLDDGSTVQLNSRSRVVVRYSPEARLVELKEGQALFQVAKESRRPFIVESGTARIRVLGTQFDVYKKPGGTVVTVLEGRVAVSDSILTAGQQLTVTATAMHKPVRANPAIATAWTQHQLIFESTPLKQAAEEFNRYNRRQMRVQGPDLEKFEIDGVFSSADPDSLVRFLREQLGAEVVETDSEIRIVRREK